MIAAVAARPIPHSLQPALDLAAQGVPVFPCWNAPGNKELDKSPMVAGGFKTASTDPEQVREWFNDGTALIGMPTGSASGLDVLDVDPKNGGDQWWNENSVHQQVTREYITQSGGRHVVFKSQARLRCSAGAIAPGVDIRAEGGYVVRWDAHGYQVEIDRDPIEWPGRLLIEVLKRQSTANGEVKPLADRLPPSADAVVALLKAMANPADTGRDRYVAVMLAAFGCHRALEEAGIAGDDDAARIEAAAVDWAQRWGLWDGTDEAAKWDADWYDGNRQPRQVNTGWRSLMKAAATLAPDEHYRLKGEEAAAEFGPWEPMPVDADPETPPPADTTPLIYAYGEKPYGDRRWLVHQMLPEVGIALLAGQWGIGKTFTAVELAVCAMFGAPFARHAVDRRCGVLWLAAEGEAEISDRLQAAIEVRPDLAGQPVPFVWADSFPLLLASDAVKRFGNIIAAARTRLDQIGTPLGLIILDTMAAGAGWDNENDAAEGQKAMNLLRQISRHYGCLVVAIDHYGKDSGSGTRGTTAKEAAADAVLALIGERQASGKIVNSRMAIRKARAGVAGREYAFELPNRTIGLDEHGRAVTTCTVTWTDKPRTSDTPEKPLEPKPQAWHTALQTVLAGKDTAMLDDWFTEGARIGLAEAPEAGDSRSEKKRKRAVFYNARTALVTAHWISVDGETVRDLRPEPALADLMRG